jgi:hypothetical protein
MKNFPPEILSLFPFRWSAHNFLLNAEGGIALILLKCLKLLSSHPEKLRPFYRTLQPMRNHFPWFAEKYVLRVNNLSRKSLLTLKWFWDCKKEEGS